MPAISRQPCDSNGVTNCPAHAVTTLLIYRAHASPWRAGERGTGRVAEIQGR